MDNFQKLLELSGFDPQPHQEEGVRWLLKNELDGNLAHGIRVRGGLLADEMGLGKTIQMLGVMVANPKPHTLIVLPRALVDQWKDAMITCLHHRPLVYHGSAVKTILPEEIEAAPIVITTYGMISARKTKPDHEYKTNSLLHKQDWDRVVYDEAHHLRNPKTTSHLGAMSLKSQIRWLVTGTPIQNSKQDFYSLCAAMGIPASYYKNDSNIVPLARSFMLKRTKANVGIELSTLRSSAIPTHWDNPAELNLAEDIHALLEFSGSHKSAADNQMTSLTDCPLAVLTRARQACIYPPLLSEAADRLIEEGLLEDSPDLRLALQSSSKIDTVVSTILHRKDNARSKLVFCHYRREIDVIRDDLLRAGLNVKTFDGRVPSKKRNQILTEQCDVLILQIKTGCEGLNLQQFSEVYFVSPHWNPAVEDQAVARCHRIGQAAETVDVFRFISQDSSSDESKRFRTLDEYASETQTGKRGLMDELTEA